MLFFHTGTHPFTASCNYLVLLPLTLVPSCCMADQTEHDCEAMGGIVLCHLLSTFPKQPLPLKGQVQEGQRKLSSCVQKLSVVLILKPPVNQEITGLKCNSIGRENEL